MTEDLWAEKPGFDIVSLIFDDKTTDSAIKVYNAELIDAFHEKLKSSFDESMADCHHSLEIIAKKLGEYMEKAEKLETVREFVLSRRDDIEKDMENFWMLKPVLDYFLEEAEG